MNRHTDQPIRKPLDHAERGIRTYFDDLDRACVDTLEKRFGHLVPEERIRAMRDLPTRFENRKDFEASYTAVEGKAPGRDVGGYSKGLEEPAHVDIENSDAVPEITMHERVHQLSDAAAERILGEGLYEGATQEIALDAARLNPEFWPPQGYPEETRMAAQLREAVGSDAFERAYFQGDAADLRQNLERRLQDIPDATDNRPTF